MDGRKLPKRKLASGEVAHSILGPLSEREMTLLRMVGEGCGNQEIAENMNLAPTTVRNSIVRIRSKLGLDSRYKLISYAARRGFLMDDEGSSSGNGDE